MDSNGKNEGRQGLYIKKPLKNLSFLRMSMSYRRRFYFLVYSVLV